MPGWVTFLQCNRRDANDIRGDRSLDRSSLGGHTHTIQGRRSLRLPNFTTNKLLLCCSPWGGSAPQDPPNKSASSFPGLTILNLCLLRDECSWTCCCFVWEMHISHTKNEFSEFVCFSVKICEPPYFPCVFMWMYVEINYSNVSCVDLCETHYFVYVERNARFYVNL